MEITGVRNIVFDMGNVLIGFRWQDMLENDRGLDPERAREVARAVFKSETWGRFDLGELKGDEIYREFEKTEPGLYPDIEWFLNHADEMGVDRPGTWELVRGLQRKGYGIYVLSNYSEQLYPIHAAGVEKAIHFDGRLISYEVHCLKPNREIYERFLSRYGLAASECIFLDDITVNVEGAKAVGMKGVVVKSEEAVNEILGKWLN